MTKQQLRRRTLLSASLAAPLGVAIISRTACAAPIKLRVAATGPNDPKYASGRVYYDNLMKYIQVNGIAEQVSMQFFPDNQLGQEIDAINSVKLGVIDILATTTSIAANLVPLVGVFDLGYLFNSFQHQTQALDAGASKPVEEALLKQSGIHMIGWCYGFGARNILAKRPVNSPADLSGMKIRTLPNPIITECLNLMGAAATPLAFGEIYTALQAGVLDGLEHDAPDVLVSKFYEGAKYYAQTRHIYSPFVGFFSDVAYKRMPPALREKFLDAANKASIDCRLHALAVEKEAFEVLKSKGVMIIDCDTSPFHKRVLPQTEAFIKAHPDAKPIIDIINSNSV